MSQNFTGSQQTFLDTMETTQTEIGQYNVQWMSRAETRINKINYQDLFLKQLLDQIFFFFKGGGIGLVLHKLTDAHPHTHTTCTFPPPQLPSVFTCFFPFFFSLFITQRPWLLKNWFCSTDFAVCSLAYAARVFHQMFYNEDKFSSCFRVCWLKTVAAFSTHTWFPSLHQWR